MRYFEPLIVNAMFVLALFVQLAVHGMTHIRTDGALLEGYAPYFGVPYGVAFLAFQLWYCRSCDHRRGFAWIFLVWVGMAALMLVTFLVNHSVNVTLDAFSIRSSTSPPGPRGPQATVVIVADRVAVPIRLFQDIGVTPCWRYRAHRLSETGTIGTRRS